MKPTSVIVLALLLLSPALIQVLRFALPSIGSAFVLTVLYYMKGTRWIQSLAGGESLYRVEPQNPWDSLREFFSNLPQLADLILQGLSFYAGLPLLLVLMVLRRVRPLGRLWLLLLLQVLAIALLDGAHSFKHRYYFMGTLPFICLLLQAALDDLKESRQGQRIRWAFFLLIGGSFLAQVAYEWRPLYLKTPAERFPSFRDCADVKNRLPDWPWGRALVFRTEPRPYPLLGLCFGERVGSDQSAYGLYLDSDPLPSVCKEVQRAGQIIAASCTY
jgi:hypothetical protein